MVFNTEGFQIVAEVAECVEGVDEGKTKREDEAEQGSNDECHNLVIGEAGGEKSDCDERRAEKEQTEVRAPGTAHVDIAHGVADPVDGNHLDERRQESDDK